jgi:hypothetical protein
VTLWKILVGITANLKEKFAEFVVIVVSADKMPAAVIALGPAIGCRLDACQPENFFAVFRIIGVSGTAKFP